MSWLCCSILVVLSRHMDGNMLCLPTCRHQNPSHTNNTQCLLEGEHVRAPMEVEVEQEEEQGLHHHLQHHQHIHQRRLWQWQLAVGRRRKRRRRPHLRTQRATKWSVCGRMAPHVCSSKPQAGAPDVHTTPSKQQLCHTHYCCCFLLLSRLYTDVAQVIETRVSREAEAEAKKAGGRATQVADFEYYVHYVGCEERTKHTSNVLARARDPGSHPALWLWLWL